MGSLLRDFEQQYATISGDITILLNEIRYKTGADRKSAIRDVEQHFEECKELFEQMELEIRALPSEERTKPSNRLQSYKAQLQTLQNDLKLLRSQSSSDRDALLNGDSDASAVFDDQRQQLLETSERLDRTTFKLDQGYRVALETEQIGSSMLESLSTQRETLTKSRNRLQEMETDLGSSSRVLTVMIRRAVQNRVAVVCILAVFLIVVGIIIYLSVRRS